MADDVDTFSPFKPQRGFRVLRSGENSQNVLPFHHSHETSICLAATYSKSYSCGNRGAIMPLSTERRKFSECSPLCQSHETSMSGCSYCKSGSFGIRGPIYLSLRPICQIFARNAPPTPGSCPIIIYRFNVRIAGLPLSLLFCPYRLQIHINSPIS